MTAPTCRMCGTVTYVGAMHPCCELAERDGQTRCVACAESAAAEIRHQRNAATCQCDEHARRRR